MGKMGADSRRLAWSAVHELYRGPRGRVLVHFHGARPCPWCGAPVGEPPCDCHPHLTLGPSL